MSGMRRDEIRFRSISGRLINQGESIAHAVDFLYAVSGTRHQMSSIMRPAAFTNVSGKRITTA